MTPRAEQLILGQLTEISRKQDEHTSAIAEVKAKVVDLAGNGQPGRVGRLEDEQKKQGDRLGALERARAYALGKMAIIGGIFTIVATGIGALLIKLFVHK